MNDVRYTVLRVERLILRTRTKGVAEALVLHFPSLRYLRIYSTRPVNPVRLFGNLETPLYNLDDYSPFHGGIDAVELASVIQQGRSQFCKELKRIGVYDTASDKLKRLIAACGKRNVGLEVRMRPEKSEEEWIPNE